MNQTIFTKDLASKTMQITRSFAAPLERVWQAWTDSTLLDQWWAPLPWKAVTKSMQFKEGGTWIYCMQGPDGEKSWAKAMYKKIDPFKSFEAVDSFADEDGNDLDIVPSMHWLVRFSAAGNETLVTIDIHYGSAEDMEKIIEMGFKEGFTAAHENLDELLKKKV